jgi:hypothetical protein
MGAAPVLPAAPVLQSQGYSIPGVVVLDVVEGGYLPMGSRSPSHNTLILIPFRHGSRGSPDHEVDPLTEAEHLSLSTACNRMAVSRCEHA